MSGRVSIVIPAYQAATTVGAAISSALWQTHGDVEVVVVDDGSTDGTGDIAAAFGDPVRVVRQPNRGVAAARNAGIEAATGELIAFVDADDLLFEQHVEALVGIHRERGGLVTANAWWWLPGGIRTGHTRHKGRFPAPAKQRLAILQQNFVSTMTLFSRRLVDEIGPFDERLARSEDRDFWLRAIFAGHPVFHQPRPLALYRWSDASLSADAEAMDASIEEVLRRAAGRPDLRPEERAYLDQRLASPGPRVLGRRGDEALRAGDYRAAARAYHEAATLCPVERPLVRKAHLMRLAPRLVGPVLRSRQVGRERELGLDEARRR